MDSRLIYSSSAGLKHKINWRKAEGEEWIYYGNGNEVKKDLVIQKIQEHFNNKILYVAFTREGSFITDTENVIERIESILGISDFLIWDSKFKSAMEFSYIGVLRVGEIST
ncbi:MAG: hypothetical protein ACJ748_03660 [Flavisolibacter sp.]|jgi:hypothetical protein